MMEPLQGITAEQCTDFVAQVAADAVFFKGLGNAYNFLKEIDGLEKLSESAAAVTRILKKGFDTHLANNPVVVTAEGVAFQMSNDLKNIGGAAKEIITDSRMFIESAINGYLAEVRIELDYLKTMFYRKDKFNGQWITIDYEHILGIDMLWNKKGRIGEFKGFHHDLMGEMRKGNIIQFTNKVVHPSGCYRADLVIDNFRVPKKTFFPEHWSRENVINKIYEAYNDFRLKGVEPSFNERGKAVISGFTTEGIEIEMCFYQKWRNENSLSCFLD